ncbi:hypothetical protein WCLP8_1100011 [uncultured Gammaproteobacteria bacterium]
MIKILSCVACDDIREEADGRVSLMGVFPHIVHVESVPHTIDRLGIMFKIGFDEQALEAGIKGFVIIPGGEIVDMPFTQKMRVGVKREPEIDGVSQSQSFLFDGRIIGTSVILPECGRLMLVVVAGKERDEAIPVVFILAPKQEIQISSVGS